MVDESIELWQITPHLRWSKRPAKKEDEVSGAIGYRLEQKWVCSGYAGEQELAYPLEEWRPVEHEGDEKVLKLFMPTVAPREKRPTTKQRLSDFAKVSIAVVGLTGLAFLITGVIALMVQS